MTQWYAGWVQGGALLTTSHNGTRVGNQYLYQVGIEQCLAARNGWILAWMAEGLGIYSQKNVLCGIKDQNSGGNTFWIAPSFFASSSKLYIQTGIAVPISQHLNGTQTRNRYYLNINIGYKF